MLYELKNQNIIAVDIAVQQKLLLLLKPYIKKAFRYIFFN